MSNPELIVATIKFHNGTVPKITWSKDGAPFNPYALDFDMIERIAKKVRGSLALFVKKCMKDGVGHSGKELKDIARQGRNLYEALFYKVAGQGGEGDPDEIKEWLADLRGEYRINFVIDRLIHIPWGLIFDADPEALSGDPEDIDIEHYKNFWSVKYRLSSIYLGISPMGIDEPKSLDAFKMISVVNKETITRARDHLTDSERLMLEWINEKFGEHIDTSTRLFDEWNKYGNDIDMLYFYCHANGTTLALSEEDELDMDTIKLKIKKSKKTGLDQSVCMVFLNGCSTAVGSATGGFLEVTGKEGFCGFLGTETSVPDVFALRFGLAFLYYFFTSDWPMFKVMERLRTEHWPLSILYSSYCHSSLRVKTIKELKAPDVVFDNFSAGRLGTSEDGVI